MKYLACFLLLVSNYAYCQNRFLIPNVDSSKVEFFIRLSKANSFLNYQNELKDIYILNKTNKIRKELFLLDTNNYFLNLSYASFYSLNKKQLFKRGNDSVKYSLQQRESFKKKAEFYNDSMAFYQKKCHKVYYSASNNIKYHINNFYNSISVLDGFRIKGIDSSEARICMLLNDAIFFDDSNDDSLFVKTLDFTLKLYNSQKNNEYLIHTLATLYYNKAVSIIDQLDEKKQSDKSIEEFMDLSTKYFEKSKYYFEEEEKLAKQKKRK